jgi:Phosphotransferase enzyme family
VSGKRAAGAAPPSSRRGAAPPSSPPGSPGDARPAVADAALADALARSLPAPVRILARRPSPYASSFPLAELDVEDGDGARRTVMWKDLTPSALLDDARRARGADAAPGWAGADSELRAYELLDGAGLGTPRRIAALHEADRAWLFLAAVRGARLEHVGDPAAWEAAARWLARAHAVLAERTAPRAAPAAPLADPATAPWPPAWVPPDPAALVAGAADPQRRRRIAALAGPLEAARAWAAAVPSATIHGEFYAANVLIAQDPAPPTHAPASRVCALDWETIARGPALLDLAALTAGRWDEPGDPLARAYREALPDPPPAARFAIDLDNARLLVAAGWLAAPAGWSPPPEQARDWLADAELIAARGAAA